MPRDRTQLPLEADRNEGGEQPGTLGTVALLFGRVTKNSRNNVGVQTLEKPSKVR